MNYTWRGSSHSLGIVDTFFVDTSQLAGILGLLFWFFCLFCFCSNAHLSEILLDTSNSSHSVFKKRQTEKVLLTEIVESCSQHKFHRQQSNS